MLVEAARLIKSRWEDLARMDVIDNGKPIWEARADLYTVTSSLEYYGGVAQAITGQHVKLANGSFAYVSREPFGVVGGVGAWNYPLQTCTWKVNNTFPLMFSIVIQTAVPVGRSRVGMRQHFCLQAFPTDANHCNQFGRDFERCRSSRRRLQCDTRRGRDGRPLVSTPRLCKALLHR